MRLCIADSKQLQAEFQRFRITQMVVVCARLSSCLWDRTDWLQGIAIRDRRLTLTPGDKRLGPLVLGLLVVGLMLGMSMSIATGDTVAALSMHQ
jgi:hypothetical protein